MFLKSSEKFMTSFNPFEIENSIIIFECLSYFMCTQQLGLYKEGKAKKNEQNFILLTVREFNNLQMMKTAFSYYMVVKTLASECPIIDILKVIYRTK